jgi:hypothetical protein
MVRGVSVALLLLFACAAPGSAQETGAPGEPPPDAASVPGAPRTMVGSWEFSTADREKACTITFRSDTGPGGQRVLFDPACTEHFPFVSEIAAWSHAETDFLRLLDAKGETVLEFSEVEGGIFEAPRPGVGILFIQNATAAGPPPRTIDQTVGDWTVMRGAGAGRPICTLSLARTAVGEEFAIQVRSPCDAFVTRFGPATWQVDRGELVFRSARGQYWRFEPSDSGWRRVPESANPLTLVRN